MKRVSLLLMLACALSFYSCSSDDIFDDNVPAVPEQPNVINRDGKTDGIGYSLKNVTLNPDVVVLNSGNSELLSSEQELSQGIIKVNSNQLINEGAVLYIQSGDYTGLKKAVTVRKTGAQSYELQTEQAQLGELFESGDINLSLDMYEASKAKDEKNGELRAGVYEIDRTYEIINLMEEYQWGDVLKFNPSTKVKANLYMNMSFGKSQLLPSKFTTYFEIVPAMNPLLAFSGSVNQTYEDDIVRFIPGQMIEFIKEQEFDIDIPLNVLGIESIPAKVKIQDINIPTTIEANLANQTDFTFHVNGSFKVGYEMDIDGLNAKVTPIYENNIIAEAPGVSDMQGELLTNTQVVIVPTIYMLDGLYKISGDISFGFKSETYGGGADLPENPGNFASKGVFTSNMTVLVDLLVMKVPVEIFNQDKEIWNMGSFDKKVIYSDLSWKVSSKYSNSILLLSRLYETDFTVKYKYPILGKKVPAELLVSYEVYQDNNKTKIQTVTNEVIVPADVTADSFTFKLNIPFKSKLFSYQTKSYLKNIVIKDRNGYVYEGIYNTAKGINENSFEIKR